MRVMKIPDNNGKVRGFVARVGDFFGEERKTANLALKSLDDQLETFHPLNHAYIRCGDGTVLHLFQIPSHGWNYNIIPPSGYAGAGVGVHATYTDARRKAIEHANREFGGYHNG
jgi:hypothetical protein